MKSIIIIARKGMRANLPQAISLFLGIFFASLLLLVSMHLFFSLNKTFDRSYINAGAPQVSGMYNPKEVPISTLMEFLKEQRIEDLSISQFYLVDYIKFNESRIDFPYVVAFITGIHNEQMEPAAGEVFVSKKMAAMLGVKTGDSIDTYKKEKRIPLTVAKIVPDYLTDAPSTSVCRMWLNKEYADTAFIPDAGYFFEGRFKDNQIPDGNGLYQLFTKFIGEEPIGYFYTFEQIRARYTTLYDMFGIIIFIISMLAMVTVLIVLGLTAKGAIVADTKKIGIYKTLGFSRVNILGIYLTRYLWIAIAASCLGALLGTVLTRFLFSGIFSGLPLKGLPNTLTFIIVAVLTVCLAAFFILFLSLYNPIKIDPIKAMRSHAGSHQKKKIPWDNRWFSDKRFPVTIKLSIIKLSENALRSLTGILTSFALSVVVITALSIYASASNINEEPEKWGLTKADIFLMPQGEVNSHEVLEELQSDSRIAYTYGAHRNVLHMRTPSEEQYTQVAIEVYETPLDSHVNLYYYEGRMPIGLTEAAVGYGMAKSKNIQIGDTLYINKFDTYITVTVVGIYPSFYDGGETIQMTTDDMDAFFNGGNLGYYNFVLNNSSDRFALVEEWNTKYAGDFNFLPMQDNAQSIKNLLLPIFAGVILAISIILYTVTGNINILKMKEERYNIGILQGIGFTKRNIKNLFLIQNIILSCMGGAIGIVFGVFGIPYLLKPMVFRLGLASVPYFITPFNIIIAFLGVILLFVLSTISAARQITKYESVELIKGR